MFFDRDLSWLGFNFRVLQEAADKNVPLYERLKFLSIFSSNLDEFFRVRYPSIVALSSLDKKTRTQLSFGNAAKGIREKVQEEINQHLEFFGSILTDQIIPELEQNKIIFYYNSIIQEEHLPEIREIFLSQVLSFIQPVYLDGKSTPAFMPQNNQLYFVVTLTAPDSEFLKQAIINIPSEKLKRFFVLTCLEDFEYVIFIDDIVRQNLVYLFPGLEISGVYSIKFNRDAELHLIDEYRGNLLSKIDKQLKKRDFGAPSRFLYEKGMPENLLLFLASALGVNYLDMFAGGRYHNLRDLISFPDFNKNLYYKKLKPLSSANVMNSGDIFNILNTQDILLHIPYQSYNPVLSFFNQAAVDTEVTEIFITLYRVAAESHIVNALISAAKNGKKVTAFIELKARFDEANNIRWSKIMKQAGVKIIYSIPNIKVHSKIALIKKHKSSQIHSYAILSTGNFNETTAQFYTDHVLMTIEPSIIAELNQLFNFLKKKDKSLTDTKLRFNTLLVSQFNLTNKLKELIETEIKKTKNNGEGMIRIKVNNLQEPGVISLLYKASQAGVKINLMVRSVCCLRPGLKEVSENIAVKRLVDRYLEHTRIFIFGGGSSTEVIIGSADLMTRNLYHRIEVCVPVKDDKLKQELIDYFEIQWTDNEKAVILDSDLNQHRLFPENGKFLNAQQTIYNDLQNRQ
jgi:polyphosphate kinase